MNCANHPDLAALGTCRECGRPLCSLCVYFREGQVVCSRHTGQSTPGPAAGPEPAPPADEDAETVAPTAGRPGAIVPAPLLIPTDARLEPLPMALRPGWTEEPPVPRPSTLGETLGLIGLVVALAAGPFICCGLGAWVGAPLALIGGGMCVAALILAPRTRNPTQARWTGGIGLGVSLLVLGISLCYVAATFALVAPLNRSIFSILTATP